jgi:hypothetical protein
LIDHSFPSRDYQPMRPRHCELAWNVRADEPHDHQRNAGAIELHTGNPPYPTCVSRGVSTSYVMIANLNARAT